MPANPLNMDDFGGEMYQLAMSKEAQPLLDAVKKFIAEEVDPWTQEFHELQASVDDPWTYHPQALELLEAAKAKAKSQGLWNFFLPNAETGEGLSNLDYAYIAQELGKNSPGLGVPQLRRPRHRQHGGHRAGRYPRAEEAVARATARRRDPVLPSG